MNNIENILTKSRLDSLLSKFKNILKVKSEINITSKEYGSAQKQIAYSQKVIENLEECLIFLDMNETNDFTISANNLLQLIMQSNDCNSIIMEIRAAAGGDEAALFVEDLLNLYTNFCVKSGFKISILETSTNDIGGYKSCTINIVGKQVYNNFFLESGVHRVQRIPKTETKGRIHTSTVSVYVYEEVSEYEQKPINEKDLEITFCRSSGAGGQHVNTTDSAVRIKHIPTGLVVECQNERSQHSNKASALKVLHSRLYDFHRQKEMSKRNEDRVNNIGNADRSEKIRTYNYPQNRITDHRFNVHSQNLIHVMEGNFKNFIKEMLVANTIQEIENIV